MRSQTFNDEGRSLEASSFGQGYNTKINLLSINSIFDDPDTVFKNAAKGTGATNENTEDFPGQIVIYKSSTIDSYRELRKFFKLNASAAYSGGTVSVSSGLSLMNSLKISEYNLFVVVSIEVFNASDYIKVNGLNVRDKIINHLKDPETRKALPFFIGDSCIYEKRTGGYFHMVYSYVTSSVKEKQALKGSLDLAVKALMAKGAAHVDVETELQNLAAYTNISISCEGVWVDDDSMEEDNKPQSSTWSWDYEHLKSYFSKFPKLMHPINGHPIIYATNTIEIDKHLDFLPYSELFNDYFEFYNYINAAYEHYEKLNQFFITNSDAIMDLEIRFPSVDRAKIEDSVKKAEILKDSLLSMIRNEEKSTGTKRDIKLEDYQVPKTDPEIEKYILRSRPLEKVLESLHIDGELVTETISATTTLSLKGKYRLKHYKDAQDTDYSTSGEGHIKPYACLSKYREQVNGEDNFTFIQMGVLLIYPDHSEKLLIYNYDPIIIDQINVKIYLQPSFRNNYSFDENGSVEGPGSEETWITPNSKMNTKIYSDPIDKFAFLLS